MQNAWEVFATFVASLKAEAGMVTSSNVDPRDSRNAWKFRDVFEVQLNIGWKCLFSSTNLF